MIDHRISVLDTSKFAAIVGIGPNFAFDHKGDTLLMSYGVETFSVCLQRPSASAGYLTWGPTLGEEALKRDAVRANVIGKHHWVTRMNNVTFISPTGAHLENAPCMGTGCAAIIDSGTSLIAALGMVLMQLSEQIQPIKEDCSNLHELPILHFVIDGIPLELPPQAYVMRVTGAMIEANDVWDVLFFKPKIRKLHMCMPAFMQMDNHTTFDRKVAAMYFSTAGPDCNPLPLKPHTNNK